MVGRNIQQDSDIGTEIVHVIKLERAQFDDIILMRILCHLKGQGITYIACQSCIVACLLENMIDQRGCSSLTIRSCDTDHL